MDYSAFVILLTGIYAISASIGELRSPGMWASMIDNLADVTALRFITGIVLIVMGGVAYAVGSWDMSDWVPVIVKVLGAWMVIEGALFLAVGDLFIEFGRRMMGAATKLWVSLSLLMGIAFVIAAALRF